jgi:hypothetical protein
MWVQPPGGVPTGAMTSRIIIQIMCKKDKKGSEQKSQQTEAKSYFSYKAETACKIKLPYTIGTGVL